MGVGTCSAIVQDRGVPTLTEETLWSQRYGTDMAVVIGGPTLRLPGVILGPAAAAPAVVS